MCKGVRFQGKGAAEETVAATRGTIRSSQGHADRGLAGCVSKADTVGQT